MIKYPAIKKWWTSYKFRFVPWMKINLKKQKTIRFSQLQVDDKIISDQDALQQTFKILTVLEESKHCKKLKDLLYQKFGFLLTVQRSHIADAGNGVFVTKGIVKKNTIIAFYPGTVYFPYQPIFLQSINNPFIFKCSDSVLIDGNNKGLSKVIYKSCGNRDRLGPHLQCDLSWFNYENKLKNPFNIGQIVNNQTSSNPANVCYQEVNIQRDIPINLREFLPNNFFKPTISSETPLRTVVLVSTRDIHTNEEILSSYFNIIKS